MRVVVVLLLCCMPQICHPQLMLPFSSGFGYRSALANPPKGQGADSAYVVEMFYDDLFYVCKKSPQIGDYLHSIESAIFSLEPFYDYPYKGSCNATYHPFYLLRVPGRTSKNLIGLTGQYAVLRGETTDVVLKRNKLATIPSRYFCRMKNVTNLEILGNEIESSANFGFSQQCSPNACNPKLNKLQLVDNGLKILVSGSFCGFPNLEELDVSKNIIESVDELAFTKLDNLLKLRLSENRMKALPHGVFQSLQGLIMLDLSYNRLQESVFAELKLLSNLKVLRLSSNAIEAIKSNSIDGMWSLTELYLEGNRLVSLDNPFGQLHNLATLALDSNNISRISSSFFVPLANLTVLTLGHNKIGKLSGAHFAANEKLASLDVTGNNISSVPDLSLVKSLKKLVLSQNKIKTITPEDGRIICDMSQLEELLMEIVSLEHIAEGTFECSLNLTVFNLNSNLIRSVRGAFANARIERLLLARNEIEELWMDDIPQEVVEVDLSDNHITTLRSPLKQRLRNMSLTSLNLADNLLTDLSDVHLPSSLEYLLLSNNKLQFLELGNLEVANNSTCFALENLKMLSLASNEIQSICPLIFYLAASETLPDVDLGGNPMNCSCEISFLVKYEDNVRRHGPKLNLPDSGTCPSWQQGPDNKQMSSDSQHKFSCMATKTNDFCECNLNSLYSNICNFPCPERCLCYLSSDFQFQFINCSAAGFVDFPSLTTHLPLELHLTNNSLKVITAKMLRSYSEAVALNINDNRVSSIESGAFRNVPHLRVLNLETNLLKSLPDGAFDNLLELAELYLAHNRLMHLTANVFQPLQAIKLIQLHDNNLSNFSIWNYEAPTSLARLSLRDNPWSCDCHYVEQFRNWLQNYSTVVEDVTQLFCTADNGTVQNSPLISFNSSQCYVLKDEIFVANVVIWTSVLASLVLVALMNVLVFMYRREMQVLIYSNYKVRLFYKNNEDLDGDKFYDAFIAHSALDEEFLANELVPGLEKIERPYRLCIHQRDFLVGAVITESILEAVEKSRRTIVLLSENFVRSEWCRFEFKSAHLKTLADRCNRLIVIVMGKLPPDLDPEMKLYLKTNTYLEWGDRLFWEKLYFALPDRKLPAVE